MQTDNLILLVEHDPNGVFLFELALANHGVSNPIRVLQSSAEALTYLKGENVFANRELFPLPALLFLDVDETEDSAGHLLSFIRRTPALAPLLVVGLSDEADYDRKQQFFDLGINAFFHKQDDVGKSIGLIREIDLLKEVLDTFRSTPKEEVDR